MLSESTSQGGKDGKDGLPGVGFKLTPAGNFDLQRKRLTNVAEGTGNDDAVFKHQIDTLKNQLRADSLQVDGSSHMTGDLDLRGQKLINPGEIEMNRKLITNLDTDEDNDLSAVNMITLKKFHPAAPEPTHEVTKDIDLKELFNVINAKQNVLSFYKSKYDTLMPFADIQENFLFRQKEFPMETQLNMNHNSITNLKDPQFDREAATKFYADKKLALSGGEMSGVIDMGGNRITNAAAPSQDSDVAIKGYADLKLSKSGGTLSGNLNLNGNKIENLGDPTGDEDAVPKKFVDAKISENGISATSHPPDEFRYLMEDVNESSSESNITVTGILDYQQSPHNFNKKAYSMRINKRAVDSVFLGRMGFNMFKIPEGEYTICVEFFPGKMDGINVNAVSTSLNVNRQATKKFGTYSRSIIHIHKWKISPPEYLMLDLKWQGAASDSSPGDAHLIIYGVKEFQPNVESNVYDAPFIFESGAMVMETDLNMNNHQIRNSNLKNNFMLIGRFKRSVKERFILFDNFFSDIIIPISCKLIKVYSHILSKTSPFPQLTLHLPDKSFQSGTNISGDNSIQKFSFSNVVYKEGDLFSANMSYQSGNSLTAQITFLFEII